MSNKIKRFINIILISICFTLIINISNIYAIPSDDVLKTFQNKEIVIELKDSNMLKCKLVTVLPDKLVVLDSEYNVKEINKNEIKNIKLNINSDNKSDNKAEPKDDKVEQIDKPKVKTGEKDNIAKTDAKEPDMPSAESSTASSTVNDYYLRKSLGGYAGLCFSNYVFDPEEVDGLEIDNGRKILVQFGACYDYRGGRWFGIELGLGLGIRGFEANLNGSRGTEATMDGTQVFIEAPVLGKLFLVDGFYLGVGGLLGILAYDDIAFKTEDKSGTTSFGNKMDFRLLLGIGYDIYMPDSNVTISPNIRLHVGLVDLDEDSGSTVKSAIIELNFSVRYNL